MSQSLWLRSALLPAVLAAGEVLTFLQWNPHWQCFLKDPGNCGLNARAALQSLLENEQVDFANIVEFEGGSVDPLPGWSMLERRCSEDLVTVLYNASRWQPSPVASSSGCMVGADRPFIVQEFESVLDGDKVVVVGSHFPHTQERQVLAEALRTVQEAGGAQQVVLLADTNQPSTRSSERIMRAIGIDDDTIFSTDLEPTCCFNSGFPAAYTFDRIASNFGQAMATQVLFDDMPPWARIGEFHKGIVGKLNVGSRQSKLVVV
eukprot:gb/GFBE01012364.1/.p1 GENE.gb/GFBE01012364.1/~~gb/GFBE01012364.1/.p1  ORF type:complete len:262 (+),score=51.17 gb/GFBE01012364.1/:1-786(+)